MYDSFIPAKRMRLLKQNSLRVLGIRYIIRTRIKQKMLHSENNIIIPIERLYYSNWNSSRSGDSVSPKLGDSISQIRDSISPIGDGISTSAESVSTIGNSVSTL